MIKGTKSMKVNNSLYITQTLQEQQKKERREKSWKQSKMIEDGMCWENISNERGDWGWYLRKLYWEGGWEKSGATI